MTHRPSRSSTVSGHSKTKTHPQLSVKPPPLARVKRATKFRPQPEQPKESHWQYSQETPEPLAPTTTTPDIASILREHQELLPGQGFQITEFERIDSSNTENATAFALASVQPVYEEAPNSEEAPFLTGDSVVTYPSWTQTPEPVFELDPTMSVGYMHQPLPNDSMSSYNSHDYSHTSYSMAQHASPYAPHSGAQPILPTPTTAPSTAYLPSFPSPGVQRSPNVASRRASQSRVEAGLPPYGGQQSPYSTAGRSSTVRSSPVPLAYSSSSETSSILTPPTAPSTSSYAHHQHAPNHLSYSSYQSQPPQYVSSADYISSYPASAAPGPPMYAHASAAAYASQYASAGPHDASDPSRNVRVVSQPRPKPQCWEHGCNGRQFSTFSNLLRHQREKSGTAGKSYCPRCGAEFTRTTAMKGHMNNDKCKPRRTSETG